MILSYSVQADGPCLFNGDCCTGFNCTGAFGGADAEVGHYGICG